MNSTEGLAAILKAIKLADCNSLEALYRQENVLMTYEEADTLYEFLQSLHAFKHPEWEALSSYIKNRIISKVPINILTVNDLIPQKKVAKCPSQGEPFSEPDYNEPLDVNKIKLKNPVGESGEKLGSSLDFLNFGDGIFGKSLMKFIEYKNRFSRAEKEEQDTLGMVSDIESDRVTTEPTPREYSETNIKAGYHEPEDENSINTEDDTSEETEYYNTTEREEIESEKKLRSSQSRGEYSQRSEASLKSSLKSEPVGAVNQESSVDSDSDSTSSIISGPTSVSSISSSSEESQRGGAILRQASISDSESDSLYIEVEYENTI